MAGQFEGAEKIGGIVGEVGLDTKGVDTGVDHVKKKLDGLKPNFAAIEQMARRVFLGLLGIGGFAIKAFADAEQADTKLRSSLQQSLEQAKDSKAGIDALANSLDKIKGKTVTVAAKATTHTTAGVPKMGDIVAANQASSLDATMQKLNTFADAMQRVTVYSRNAVKEQMAFALNLGVTADDLEGVTKIGAGLATTLFGGDLKAGVEAASKAYSGNFRELQRLIPGLKDAGSAQEKWAMVIKAGQSGMAQAESNANTFSGGMTRLWHEVEATAESFGALLVPQLRTVTTFLEALSMKLQSLTPAQKEQVVRWAEIAAGIAAAIAFGPAIVGFCTTIIGAFVAVGEALVGIGATIVGVVTGPFGLILAGLAAIATGFAYLIGSGNTATSKTLDGFMQIASFLDVMLGSWQGFVGSLTVLWDKMRFAFEDVWVSIKRIAIEVWEYLKANFPNVVYGWGGALAKWATQAMGLMKQVGVFIKKMWDDVVDYVADKMADSMIRSQAQKDVLEQFDGKKLSKADTHLMAVPEVMRYRNAEIAMAKANIRAANPEMSEKEVGEKALEAAAQKMPQIQANLFKQYEQMFAGKKLDKNQLQQMVDAEVAQRMADAKKMRQQRDTNKEIEFSDDTKAIEDETKKTVAAIEKWRKDGLAMNGVDHYRERQANLAKNDEERRKLEAERAKVIAEDLAKLQGLPKLSDKVKAIYEEIQKHLSLGDIGKFIDDIQKQAEELKKQAADTVNQVQNPKMNPNFVDPNAGKAGKSIEETFKENLRKQLLPAMLVNQEEEKKKREAEAQKKADEANRKALLEAQKKQANAADANTQQLQNLNDRLQQPLTMGLA